MRVNLKQSATNTVLSRSTISAEAILAVMVNTNKINPISTNKPSRTALEL